MWQRMQSNSGEPFRRFGVYSMSGPDGETDIMPRFERGVPGSTPGRGALRKGYPMGDGNRLEAGRALTRPCGFNSRSFRWANSPFDGVCGVMGKHATL